MCTRDSSESESCSVLSDSLWSHGLYSPWNSPDQKTGVGSLSLLQGVFPTQGSNPGLLHCRHILYQLSHQGSPEIQKRQPKHLCFILVQLALCPHCSFFVSFSPCLKQLKKIFTRSFPGGAVVENSPSNAVAEVLIPGRGTAIPPATELLSRRFNCWPHAPTGESVDDHERSHVTTQTWHSQGNKTVFQWSRNRNVKTMWGVSLGGPGPLSGHAVNLKPKGWFGACRN